MTPSACFHSRKPRILLLKHRFPSSLISSKFHMYFTAKTSYFILSRIPSNLTPVSAKCHQGSPPPFFVDRHSEHGTKWTIWSSQEFHYEPALIGELITRAELVLQSHYLSLCLTGNAHPRYKDVEVYLGGIRKNLLVCQHFLNKQDVFLPTH